MFLVERLKAWGMFMDPLILKADYEDVLMKKPKRV